MMKNAKILKFDFNKKIRKKMHQNRLKHFVHYSRIYGKKLSDEKVFLWTLFVKNASSTTCQKRRA